MSVANCTDLILCYNTIQYNTNVLIKVTLSRKRCRGTVQKLKISRRCQPWAVELLSAILLVGPHEEVRLQLSAMLWLTGIVCESIILTHRKSIS